MMGRFTEGFIVVCTCSAQLRPSELCCVGPEAHCLLGPQGKPNTGRPHPSVTKHAASSCVASLLSRKKIAARVSLLGNGGGCRRVSPGARQLNQPVPPARHGNKAPTRALQTTGPCEVTYKRVASREYKDLPRQLLETHAYLPTITAQPTHQCYI